MRIYIYTYICIYIVSSYKIHPKDFLIFREMELSSFKIKKFVIFQKMKFSSSKIKKFLIFLNVELSSIIFFLYLRRELSEIKKLKKFHPNKISYISESRNFLAKEKFLYFRTNFKSPKNQKFLYFSAKSY